MKRISIFLALAASALHAAIITERNDLFLYLPDYATFRGSSAAPGIDSCWIPYGTYTGGSGSTEYTRVTSNLVGVVYSAYDGLLERASYYPIKEPWWLFWNNNFPSNGTLRVFDWLNRGYGGAEETIEEVLALTEIENDEWWHPGAGQGYYHRGMLSRCGSRVLDALTGNTDPPIATSWSETLPFRAADSNVWINVFPSFGSLLYDSYIWVAPTNADVRPRYIHEAVQDHWYAEFWSNPVDFESVVGEDFKKSADALAEVLWSTPTPYTIEDVLSVDTGFTDGDYAHWNTNTTRLDWKRLGIICQIERQSEITMEGMDELYLPFVHSEAKRGQLSKAQYTIGSITIPREPGVVATVDISDLSWNVVSNGLTNIIAKVGTCYPTARLPRRSLAGGIFFRPDPAEAVPLRFSDAQIQDMLTQCTEGAVGADLSDLNSPNLTVEGPCALFTVGNAVSLNMSMVYVSDPDSGRRWSSGNSPVITLTASGMSLTNVVMRYSQGINKTSLASYTRCDLSERAEIITNMLESWLLRPYTSWWDRVARADMHSWEIMLDAKGDGIASFAESAEHGEDRSYLPFGWDALLRIGSASSTRRFRLSPSPVRANSYSAYANMWLNRVMELDGEVRSRMMEISGVDITSPDARTAISGSERDELTSRYKQTLDVSYTVSTMNPPGSGVALFATVNVASGEIKSVNITKFVYEDHSSAELQTPFPHSEDGWQVAEVNIRSEGTDASMSSSDDPVRVDAHQSSLSRILWKFKNLRDPNL